DVRVEKARDEANRHGRAVRFLDCAEISEIGTLECFARTSGRPPNVAIVELPHCDQVFQRPHLLGQFLAYPDDLISWPHVIHLCAFFALALEQPAASVDPPPPVIADDAAAAI